MAQVRFENVTKRYPGNDAPTIKEVALTIKDGEFLVLVGPSGCGKSTILRMLAGLIGVSGGRIHIDDRDVTDLPPKDRDIAMVFQNYALFPHMNVRDNVAFGLMIRKTPKDEIKRRVAEAVEILGIEDLLEKRPGQLSGGQRQRVALGRAIVRRPKVFLFDEPLSNLDAKLRTQMRAEISRLHRKLKATTVYVTHDQAEAMTMADRIVVLHDGVVQQCGRPLEIYSKPANDFVAGFIGTPPMNLFDAEIDGEKEGSLRLRPGGLSVPLPEALAETLKKNGGKKYRLGIRPEDICLADRRQDGNFGEPFKCEVELAESFGAEICLHCEAKGLKFQSTQKHVSEIRPGESLRMAFALDRLHLFDESGRRVDP